MPRQLATNRQLATGRVLQRDTGGSIKLPGSFSYVNIPNIPALIPGTGAFGAVFWLNLIAYPNAANVLLEYNSGNYALGWLVSLVQSQDRFAIYVQTAGPALAVPGLLKELLNKRVRIGFRVSPIDRIIRLYINGQLYASSAPIAAWDITATGDLRVGSGADLSTIPVAVMDDVCLFVGETTDQDFANDYFENIQIPGTVCRYGFDEQSGTSAADSVSGNTATLSTSALWSSEKFMGLRAAIPETMNMNRYSEDLSNAAWTKNAGVTATLTTEVPLPPGADQNTQISKVVYDGSGVAGGARVFQAIESNTAVGITYSNGFWARTSSGSIDLRYTDNATLTYTPFTVTSAWQFFPFLNLTTTTVAQLQSTISSVSGDNTPFTIYITQWQKVKGSATLPPYLKTTSTAQTSWRSSRQLIT